MLILKAIRDFSVGQKKIFGPWLTIQRQGWVRAVMDDVEA